MKAILSELLSILTVLCGLVKRENISEKQMTKINIESEHYTQHRRQIHGLCHTNWMLHHLATANSKFKRSTNTTEYATDEYMKNHIFKLQRKIYATNFEQSFLLPNENQTYMFSKNMSYFITVSLKFQKKKQTIQAGTMHL